MTIRLPHIAALVALLSALTVSAQGTRLLRHPAVSRDQVAFEYAGDLWVVPRAGGQARRLTSTPGMETDPHFSPDGSLIAFSGTVAGNTDVYVVPVAGGDAKRLTYHPGVDRVKGWTPDGRRVVFGSERTSVPQQAYLQLWTVPVDGGLAERLPMPRAFSGSYSPDGRRIAYEEINSQFTPEWYETSFWRHYRGGRTHPIRIMNLADYSVEQLPWTNSNDSDPMWIGSTVYFVSDRDFTKNLYAYHLDTKELKQLTHHDDFDIMNASAGPDAVVYEQAGYVHLVEAKTGQSRQLDIQVAGDLPWARPQFKRVAGMIRNAALSPTGIRAAFEARGDIFTVPAAKGDYRNLTRTPGVDERSPAWSPEGDQIAWISDASGEDQVMIGDQSGLTKPRAISLPTVAFYSELSWSPDGKHLLVQDNHLSLWILDATTGQATKVDTETYDEPGRAMNPVWSGDSRWVAYSKSLDNHFRAVFAYSVAEGKAHQITDGMSDAESPAFDAGGKYLYLLASTDFGPHTGWVEMSSIDRPVHRSIYLAVLRASDPSPLLPESDDERARGADSGGMPRGPRPPEGRGGGGGGGGGSSAQSADTAAAAAPDADRLRAGGRGGAGRGSAVAPAVQIDFDGIRRRIITINVPPADYANLSAGAAGTIFYTEPAGPGQGGGLRLQRYQLGTGAGPFLEGIRSYTLSADRKKLLYQAGGGGGGRGGAGGGARWGIVPTDRPAKVGDGAIDVAQLEMQVDPRAEWTEIFKETWRSQRDFFYDAKMHGANWQQVYDKYSAFLPYVGHRADLAYLIAQTGGELVVGHSYLTGMGDEPAEAPESVGMLGADFTIEQGHYRIHKIYTGENWNPELRAPLSAPGIEVHEGDYLLEVNGRPLAPPMSPYEPFEGAAGHQTVLRVGPSASFEGSRLVTVVPVASEEGLRTRAWIEGNRRTVDSLSGGRLAYVWLPNTAGGGYTAFTREYYAQQEKDGVIIDERYNHGGQVADYIVNALDVKPMGYFAMRNGKPSTSPAAGIFGPKVMIINESAGSGGDALPYYFHLRKIGPLVGTRTWGGLVGTTGSPAPIDGGGITAPSLAFYDLNGQWAIENVGISPDVEVENVASDVIRGHDPQLERAVSEGLKLLAQNPVRRVARPAPIDRASRKALAAGAGGGSGKDH